MTTEPAGRSPTTFSPEQTRHTLARAAEIAGVDDSDAVLLRHHSNAVYHLPVAGLVAKVAPPDEAPDRPARTVTLARWLSGQTVPVIEAANLPQPVGVAGNLVTFWVYLHQPADRSLVAADIAEPLKRLHSTDRPTSIALPLLDAPRAIRSSIAKSAILTERDRLFLLDQLGDAIARVAEASYGPTVVVHGDAQHRNTLLRGEDAVLADLESMALAPPEWDLVTIEVHCRRFRRPANEYTDFAAAYGTDVRQAGGYAALRDLRELRMITTNARKAHRGSPAAREVERRIEQIRARDLGGIWRIL